MSYEPTNWKDGDLVTSAKLNKIEQGIAAGSGMMVVNEVYDEDTEITSLDKTWQEIYDAAPNVIFCMKDNGYVEVEYLQVMEPGIIEIKRGSNPTNVYYATSSDAYPTDEQPIGPSI